jgi:hypothetical protein
MVRCVLAAGLIALVAGGCALPLSGLGEVPEGDAGTSAQGTGSGIPPVAPPDSGTKGASHDGGSSSGSSPEASVADSAAQPGDAAGAGNGNGDNQGGDMQGIGVMGPMGLDHGHH